MKLVTDKRGELSDEVNPTGTLQARELTIVIQQNGDGSNIYGGMVNVQSASGQTTNAKCEGARVKPAGTLQAKEVTIIRQQNGDGSNIYGEIVNVQSASGQTTNAKCEGARVTTKGKTMQIIQDNRGKNSDEVKPTGVFYSNELTIVIQRNGDGLSIYGESVNNGIVSLLQSLYNLNGEVQQHAAFEWANVQKFLQ